MTDDELLAAVRELRGKGRSPKEIARALGVRPATVTDLVRRVAVERAAVEPAKLSCLVSPGWDIGLSHDGHADWPSDKAAAVPDSGLVAVLAAREDRNQGASVCGYLLDAYCLGVKNVPGPRRMPRHELRTFASTYFAAWASQRMRTSRPGGSCSSRGTGRARSASAATARRSTTKDPTTTHVK